jgi:hypothetical protein
MNTPCMTTYWYIKIDWWSQTKISCAHVYATNSTVPRIVLIPDEEKCGIYIYIYIDTP